MLDVPPCSECPALRRAWHLRSTASPRSRPRVVFPRSYTDRIPAAAAAAAGRHFLHGACRRSGRSACLRPVALLIYFVDSRPGRGRPADRAGRLATEPRPRHLLRLPLASGRAAGRVAGGTGWAEREQVQVKVVAFCTRLGMEPQSLVKRVPRHHHHLLILLRLLTSEPLSTSLRSRFLGN